MIIYDKNQINRRKTIQGRGLINKFINSLPVELHLPGYQFCGPGTKLEKRLKRGDIGINPLDAACRVHDIAYDKYTDIENRHQADKKLVETAWTRALSKDSSIGEKLNAYLVTNAMKTKVKFGMGIKNNSSKICGKKIFTNAVKKVVVILKKEKPRDINDAIKIARKHIKKSFRGKKSKIILPRVISIPKVGGFLPLIPVLTALSALGALATGGSAIARAVNSAKTAKQQLEENARHNKSMEAIAMGKGLFLKPYKKGYGILHNIVTKN